MIAATSAGTRARSLLAATAAHPVQLEQLERPLADAPDFFWVFSGAFASASFQGGGGFAIEREDETRAFLDLQLVAVDLALDGRAWRTGKS
jgi:hypothetical protein